MKPSKIQHLLRPALARVLCAVSYGCVTVYGAALSQVSEPRSDGFVSGSVLTSVGLETRRSRLRSSARWLCHLQICIGRLSVCMRVVLGASSGAQAFVPQTGPSGDAEVR